MVRRPPQDDLWLETQRISNLSDFDSSSNKTPTGYFTYHTYVKMLGNGTWCCIVWLRLYYAKRSSYGRLGLLTDSTSKIPLVHEEVAEFKIPPFPQTRNSQNVNSNASSRLFASDLYIPMYMDQNLEF